MKFLVTGASGFIGRGLVPYLTAQGHEVTTLAHRDVPGPIAADVDCVVNLAGLAHADPGRYSREDYMHANRDFAVDLARRAADSGVRRFIQVSSIAAVAGNGRVRLCESDPLSFASPYGESKAAGEVDLKKVQGIDLVILRPPLVYGPSAPGNFGKLLKVARSSLPLPFGAVDNQRSMVGLGNLCSAILFLALAPAAKVAGSIFHVTDGDPVSLARLLRNIRQAADRPSGLLPVPTGILRLGLRALRRGDMAEQLLGDLVVDDRGLRAAGWSPPYSMEEEMLRVVKAAGQTVS